MLAGVVAEESLIPSAITDSHSVFVREAVNATDGANAGFITAIIVDDPAAVIDFVDAYLGQKMVELASADTIIDAELAYAAVIGETISATTAQDANITSAVATWNPSDKSASISLTSGNLIAGSAPSIAGAVRGTKGLSSGKAYLEITCTYSIITDSNIGVATLAANLGSVGGNMIGSAAVDIFGGWMYINNSSTSHGNIGLFNSGDVLCLALDLGNRQIWFRRNGGNWNNSGTANPATNAGGLDVSMLFTSAAAFPLATFVDANLNETINAGASAFTQTIPSGFVAWNGA
jgi:hypothetical protein